jgi:hypothetical protein
MNPDSLSIQDANPDDDWSDDYYDAPDPWCSICSGSAYACEALVHNAIADHIAEYNAQESELHADGCPDPRGICGWCQGDTDLLRRVRRKAGTVSTWYAGCPDESIAGDDPLSAATMAMYAHFDGDVDRVREEWYRVARSADPSWPFDDADFERHMRNVPRKVTTPSQRADAHERSWGAIAQALGTTLDRVRQAAESAYAARRAMNSYYADYRPDRRNWEWK